MKQVKIISGYSGPGGSTEALIQLTNALNNRNINTTFYGPNEYHLDKCNSGNQATINPEDIVLLHYYNNPIKIIASKIIYISHELDWHPITAKHEIYDSVVFLHEKHRAYHSEYNGKYHLIPNLKTPLIPKNPLAYMSKNIAGVIGSIEPRKQTHISIQRALDAGCSIVRVFGKIADTEYFNKFVLPMVYETNKVVKIYGQIEDKQKMYDSIDLVFHSSLKEVACLVKDECETANVLFFGNENTDHEVSKLTNDEIINEWIKLF